MERAQAKIPCKTWLAGAQHQAAPPRPPHPQAARSPCAARRSTRRRRCGWSAPTAVRRVRPPAWMQSADKQVTLKAMPQPVHMLPALWAARTATLPLRAVPCWERRSAALAVALSYLVATFFPSSALRHARWVPCMPRSHVVGPLHRAQFMRLATYRGSSIVARPRRIHTVTLWCLHANTSQRVTAFDLCSAVAMLGGGAGAMELLECPLCAASFDRRLDVVELAPGAKEVRLQDAAHGPAHAACFCHVLRQGASGHQGVCGPICGTVDTGLLSHGSARGVDHFAENVCDYKCWRARAAQPCVLQSSPACRARSSERCWRPGGSAKESTRLAAAPRNGSRRRDPQ